MSRALYKVAQNTATPISVTNVAMSDPNGVRPRQSRHTVIDYRIKLELSVQISGDELGLRVKLRYQHKQECMPVGCVPSASMAIPWGGGGKQRHL